MADATDRRPARLRTALATALTVLVLVPTGILFGQSWQRAGTERADTELEQQGVDYLTVLLPMVSALAAAQSEALRGVTGTPSALTTAVTQVAQVDQSIGLQLRVHERWAGLRTQVESLADLKGDVNTKFQEYVEATDLALALCNAVRDNSGLIRDQANDVSHLQQAMAVELPGAIVQVSRMGDLSLLLAGASAAQQRTLSPLFGAATEQQDTLVGALTDSLEAAVDDTTSTTLSGNLVNALDSFRRGVETMARGAAPGAEPNAATVASAQIRLQAALSGLAGVVLKETADLLATRADRIDTTRIRLLILITVAVLLVVAAIVVPRTGRRRPALAPAADDPGPTVSGVGTPDRREHSGALR